MKNTNKKSVGTVAELRKQFPFICSDQLAWEKKNNSYKTVAGFLRHLEKINAEHEEKATRPDVKEIEITIYWNKSRTWGYNPRAEYRAWFVDGSTTSGVKTCSGCGYDKESTVVSRIFNACCSGMLWRKKHSQKKAPYGVRFGWMPVFEYGVGMSCYYSISAFICGTLESVAHGKNFDAYRFILNKK